MRITDRSNIRWLAMQRWHRHFAWIPVFFWPKTWVWLETVERRLVVITYASGVKYYEEWEYRQISKEPRA